MKKSASKTKSAPPAFPAVSKTLAAKSAARKYDNDYPMQAYKLCLLGATNKELAAYFGVSLTTITAWKKTYPAFEDALNRGKKAADMEVAHSLYQATLDRVVATRQAIKCKEVYYDDKGKRVETERIEIVEVEKHIPGDFRSQQLWLRNRNPKQWSQKPEDSEVAAQKPVTLNLGEGQNPFGDEAAG